MQAGLNLRSKKPRRRKAAAICLDRPVLTGPNQLWSMNFVSDSLFDGRRFRTLCRQLQLLPNDAHPILVTDAGFRGPWLTDYAVEKHFGRSKRWAGNG